MLEAGIEPLALEGGVVVVTQGGKVEGAAVKPTTAAGGGAQALQPCTTAPVLAPVVHQMWEASMVRAYNEVLGGELQPEVELQLLQGTYVWKLNGQKSLAVRRRRSWWRMGRVPCSLVAGHRQ